MTDLQEKMWKRGVQEVSEGVITCMCAAGIDVGIQYLRTLADDLQKRAPREKRLHGITAERRFL